MRRSLTAVLALAATPALAHPGHHETLSLADQARHLLSQPDHLLAAAGLAALAALGGVVWRRARVRVRK